MTFTSLSLLLSFLILLAPSNAFQPSLWTRPTTTRLVPISGKSNTRGNGRTAKLHATTINSLEIQSPPQVIQFKEPKTNTTVILIGTMHYNPASISTVTSTIQSLASQNLLASVIIESCDVRWNTTVELLKTRRGKIFEPVLMSEMKAASDVAMEYNIPCVLGDQRINATGDSLGITFRETFVELSNPLQGWGRMYREFQEKAEVALPSGDGYLNARSILDPRLLIAAPVSFAKYPLSFLARNPISTSIFFAFLGALSVLDATNGGNTNFLDASMQEQISTLLGSLAVAGLELTFFARVMVQVLLYERNEILARNILHQCKLYASTSSGKNKVSKGSEFQIMDVFSFFSGGATNTNEAAPVVEEKGITGTDAFETFYVPGGASIQAKGGDGKVVLAVLGMAHINGIVKVLKEKIVD